MEEVVDEDDLQPKAANTDGDDIFVTLRETAQHFADKMKVKKPLTKGDIPRLKQQWYESCKDIMGGVPERLPPLREVNHKINLMDFVGPFPEVEGYNYLWVIVCRLSTYVHLIPTNTSVTASQLAWTYLKEIVRLHGIPESIVSDRDARFTSKFWKELHRMLGSTFLMSTAFHPQTDGVTERANRTIIQIIRASIRPDQKDWVQALPMTEFAINASISATTGLAPFEFQGYMPSMMK